MGKYIKKPIEIEAVQFNGSSTHKTQIAAWIRDEIACPDSKDTVHTRDIVSFDILTLEGKYVASPGDYIIKGVKGEFYPCKPNIFKLTYREVD